MIFFNINNFLKSINPSFINKRSKAFTNQGRSKAKTRTKTIVRASPSVIIQGAILEQTAQILIDRNSAEAQAIQTIGKAFGIKKPYINVISNQDLKDVIALTEANPHLFGYVKYYDTPIIIDGRKVHEAYIHPNGMAQAHKIGAISDAEYARYKQLAGIQDGQVADGTDSIVTTPQKTKAEEITDGIVVANQAASTNNVRVHAEQERYDKCKDLRDKITKTRVGNKRDESGNKIHSWDNRTKEQIEAPKSPDYVKPKLKNGKWYFYNPWEGHQEALEGLKGYIQKLLDQFEKNNCFDFEDLGIDKNRWYKLKNWADNLKAPKKSDWKGPKP